MVQAESATTKFYTEALGVCERYLSGDARKFLDAQVTGHLKRTPGTLLPLDKQELGRRCQASAALILGTKKSEQMASELLAL